jgi:hypothetical protein
MLIENPQKSERIRWLAAADPLFAFRTISLVDRLKNDIVAQI